MADFEAPVPLEEEPEAADPMAALVALSREQQQRRDEALARLRGLAQNQGTQAQGLRNMALLTSMGQNPLLQGLQHESGRQGSQLQGMAMQAESRADAAERGIDPLGIARLQQLAEHQKGQQELGQKRLTQQAEQAAAKAQAAKDKAAAGTATATAKADAKALADLLKIESGIRREILGSETGKNYLGAKSSYAEIENYVANPNPATDMALVFGAMKTVDPTSVVKEGEQQQVRNTANLPDRLVNHWKRLASGENFTQRQREEIRQMAFLALQGKAKTLKEFSGSYEPIAKHAGADMSRVMPLKIPEADAPATGLTTPPRMPATTALPSGPGGSLLLEPPSKPATKKYSKSQDTTYLFDDTGKVIGTEPGDTRGR